METEVQSVLAAFGAHRLYSDAPLPEVRVKREGGRFVVSGKSLAIEGRLSARRLFAADFWGAAFRIGGRDVVRVWPDPAEDLTHEVADALLTVGLEMSRQEEDVEALLLLTEALGWRPDAVPSTLAEVSATMRARIERLLEGSDEALSFAKAYARCEREFESDDRIDRVRAAHMLEEMTDHFLSTAPFRRVFDRAMPLAERENRALEFLLLSRAGKSGPAEKGVETKRNARLPRVTGGGAPPFREAGVVRSQGDPSHGGGRVVALGGRTARNLLAFLVERRAIALSSPSAAEGLSARIAAMKKRTRKSLYTLLMDDDAVDDVFVEPVELGELLETFD
jgi:hypothetical protein